MSEKRPGGQIKEGKLLVIVEGHPSKPNSTVWVHSCGTEVIVAEPLVVFPDGSTANIRTPFCPKCEAAPMYGVYKPGRGIIITAWDGRKRLGGELTDECGKPVWVVLTESTQQQPGGEWTHNCGGRVESQPLIFSPYSGRSGIERILEVFFCRDCELIPIGGDYIEDGEGHRTFTVTKWEN